MEDGHSDIEDEAKTESRHIRFSRELNIGHVLQAGIVAVGLIAWAVTRANSVEQAQHDYAELKTTMMSQLQQMAKDIGSIRNDMRTIGEQRVHLENIERWINNQENRNVAQETRQNDLDRQVVQLRAELNGVTQASQVRLPGGQRR